MTTLSQWKLIGFLPSKDLGVSRAFYQDKLGLRLNKADDFALEFEISGTRLRISKVAEFDPADYTVLGWEVDNIESTVNSLMSKGIQFERYDGMPQNELAICVFPGGSKVAWFKDPDRNTLSITQFA